MKKFLLFLSLILFISCHKDKNFTVYNNIKWLIEFYMIKYQAYNTFILYHIDRQTFDGDSING